MRVENLMFELLAGTFVIFAALLLIRAWPSSQTGDPARTSSKNSVVWMSKENPAGKPQAGFSRTDDYRR
jgi:hypothetical protein